MNSSPQPHRLTTAFTLVELLVVIAIIAILMGLHFPAIGVIKEQARKVQARNDLTNVVAAVKQYQTEYGKYPTVTNSPAVADADTLVGDTAAGAAINNNALFDTLRAIPRGLNQNHTFNPRRIVFFEGKGVTDNLAPRAGFADNATDAAMLGCFFDPWGKQYNIVIDSNYDNVILLDVQYTDFAAVRAPRVGVGSFSLGRDNTLGTADDKTYRRGSTTSDDVISWQ